MKQKQIVQRIYQLIKENEWFLIPLHLSPDGDMVASALAFREFLIGLGKKVRIISEDPLGAEAEIDFIIPARELIESEVEIRAALSTNYDVLVCLDLSGIKRFTKEDDVPVNRPIVNIDHHEDNPKNFGDLVYVEEATSTAQVILHFFKENQVKINPLIARCMITIRC